MGFISLFLFENQPVKANANARFTKFLSSVHNLHSKPTTKPTWKAFMTYHPPMFGLLQSSYDHVEKELEQMRDWHKSDQILFIGGDGLSIMRVNHLIHQDPAKYMHSPPMVVPVQGESPHGLFHILHSGWRLYLRFIRQCALYLNKDNSAINKVVKDEPTVSDLNHSLHFLNRITRAAADYLVHISQNGGPALGDLQQWREASERNIDLAWVFHFLYDYAFLILDFKNAVRRGDSKHIDLLWREFLHFGRANTANKTQYCPMAIMRVFWGYTMHPELKHLYDNIRSIPMSFNEGSKVGWDMPCEWLNLAITQGVQIRVSEERITKFVAGYALTDTNYQLLRAQFLDQRKEYIHKMKSIEEDSVKLKTFFLNKIGRDWATASRRNAESELGITRGVLPWVEVRDAARAGGNDSVPSYVETTVRRYTNTFYRFS